MGRVGQGAPPVERPETSYEESVRWVESDSVRLAVYESGAPDGPPLVCMHGATNTHDYVLMRNRILPRAGYRVISYDARGHGRSSPPADRDYTHQALLTDLEAVMDALEIDAVVFIGVSMGCHAALSYAMRYPERVAGIVGITPAYDPEHSFRPDVLARSDALAAGLRAGGPAGFVEAYGHPVDMPHEQFDVVMDLVHKRMHLHADYAAVADAIEVMSRSRPYRRIEDIAVVQQPVLVIGARDQYDTDHPLAIAEAHAACLPNARMVVEPPGRFPIAWSGGRLSRLIRDFLREAGWAREAEPLESSVP
jgi:pimeloyl-ACP methyl ester carboxylesterase